MPWPVPCCGRNKITLSRIVTTFWTPRGRAMRPEGGFFEANGQAECQQGVTVPPDLAVTPLKHESVVSNVPGEVVFSWSINKNYRKPFAMTHDLTTACLAGEIDNTTNNRIDGWLRLRGTLAPVILEITGNCASTLQGQRILFEHPESSDSLVNGTDLTGLSFHQVGAAGNVSWVAEKGEQCGRLMLEWYGQNGHMVIEWPAVSVQFKEPHVPLLSAATAPGLDFSAIPPASWAWSPSLELVHQETASGRELATMHAGDPWSSDIDILYKFLDELSDGSHDVPIISLLESPPPHEPPARMKSAEIQEMLRDLIAQLAMLGISVTICPHFSAERSLRWLLDEVVFEEQVHPQMVQHGYVSFYMSSDRCTECSLEFEMTEE